MSARGRKVTRSRGNASVPFRSRREKTPQEVLSSRYRLLNPHSVRITTLCASGTILEEVGFLSNDGRVEWHAAADLEQQLLDAKHREEEEILLNRVRTRLGRDPPASLADLSKSDLTKVKLSQSAYNRRFPPSSGDDRKSA